MIVTMSFDVGRSPEPRRKDVVNESTPAVAPLTEEEVETQPKAKRCRQRSLQANEKTPQEYNEAKMSLRRKRLLLNVEQKLGAIGEILSAKQFGVSVIKHCDVSLRQISAILHTISRYGNNSAEIRHFWKITSLLMKKVASIKGIVQQDANIRSELSSDLFSGGEVLAIDECENSLLQKDCSVGSEREYRVKSEPRKIAIDWRKIRLKVVEEEELLPLTGTFWTGRSCFSPEFDYVWKDLELWQ